MLPLVTEFGEFGNLRYCILDPRIRYSEGYPFRQHRFLGGMLPNCDTCIHRDSERQASRWELEAGRIAILPLSTLSTRSLRDSRALAAREADSDSAARFRARLCVYPPPPLSPALDKHNLVAVIT